MIDVIPKSRASVDMECDYYVDEYINGIHEIRYTATVKNVSKLLRYLKKQFISKYGDSEQDRLVDNTDVMALLFKRKKGKIVWIKPCGKCGYNRKKCLCKNT